MRDPHVVSLIYVLDPGEANVSFSDVAAPVEIETKGFSLRLAEGVLAIAMHDHHPTESSARDAVEPYLRAWEIQLGLTVGGGSAEFSFRFESSELVDRDPPPPGTPQTVQAESVMRLRLRASGTGHVERANYPSPVSDFAVDPDVETLWTRWCGYLDERESLQTMAYFCLTVVEHSAGGRDAVASHYAISSKVISTLATLSTETGDATTARKMGRKLRPLTDPEQTWLEAAVRALIERAGEVAADAARTRTQITMAHLPSMSAT